MSYIIINTNTNINIYNPLIKTRMTYDSQLNPEPKLKNLAINLFKTVKN